LSNLSKSAFVNFFLTSNILVNKSSFAIFVIFHLGISPSSINFAYPSISNLAPLLDNPDGNNLYFILNGKIFFVNWTNCLGFDNLPCKTVVSPFPVSSFTVLWTIPPDFVLNNL